MSSLRWNILEQKRIHKPLSLSMGLSATEQKVQSLNFKQLKTQKMVRKTSLQRRSQILHKISSEKVVKKASKFLLTQLSQILSLKHLFFSTKNTLNVRNPQMKEWNIQ
jgi:hypothetical protein